jgi:hypothetical protein
MSTTTTTEPRHRDDSPEAEARCAHRERSVLTVRLHDGLHIPRHSAAHRDEVAS